MTTEINDPVSTKSMEWQIVQDSSTIDNKFRWEEDEERGDGTYVWVPYKYRERFTRVFQKVTWPQFTWPSGPIDPYGLVGQGWKCVNRDLQRGYGESLGTYSETYELLGPWTAYDEEDD